MREPTSSLNRCMPGGAHFRKAHVSESSKWHGHPAHATYRRHRQDCLCYTPAKTPVLAETSVPPGVCNFRKCYKSGMTLIELLVVIAIVGILFALIYPNIKKGVDAANRTKCLNNLRQIGAAAELYTQENDNTFPKMDAWPGQLGVYLVPGGNIFTLRAGTKTVFWCPAVTVPTDPASYNGIIEYGINAQGYAGLGRFYQDPGHSGIAITDSKRFAFMDSTGKNVWDTTPTRVNPSHGMNNYNAIFADGHAENMSTAQYPLGSSAWRNLFWGYTRY